MKDLRYLAGRGKTDYVDQAFKNMPLAISISILPAAIGQDHTTITQERTRYA
jgi:hypothetical protein